MSIEKGKISNQQLLFLIAGFVLGSALLIDFTVGLTEQQTWMVLLAGLVITAPVILSYVVLAKRFPGMNLVQINDMVYGRFLGKVISIYYIFFFSMTLSFNIRDVGELYITFLMQDTPFIFFLIVFTASTLTTCAVSKISSESFSLSTPIPMTISRSFISLAPKQPDKAIDRKKNRVKLITENFISFPIATSLLLFGIIIVFIIW
jgi:magnesium-transporting ATPase (P-type)